MRAALVVLLLLTAGCSSLLDELTRPDLPVKQSPISKDGWNTDPRFLVVVETDAYHRVRIVASGPEAVSVEDLSRIGEPVQVTLADGTWDITYYVDDHRWATFKKVRFDSTPPTINGLERVGDAEYGAYTLGAGAVVEPGATLQVFRLDGPQSSLIATQLPVSLSGLQSGLHVYRVVARDAAGNTLQVNVQVRAGDAKELPAGQYDFGIVARYTNEARLWDISDFSVYATPAQAQAAVGGQWLGSGRGVTPDDPVVQGVVQSVVSGQGTTTAIAWDLFRWMVDNLDYDRARLQSTTLMLPRQVIDDTEDPDAEQQQSQDAGDDGLADDGSGNGVRGGVCRDLAGTYVSLLRAAGVPARLVTGYLSGDVDGFHAWVEFYGGDVAGNPGPWIPVDVSPLDGQWDDPASGGVTKGFATAMAAFGIKHADYLTLRALPEERDGWSAALSTQYTYRETGQPPDIRFKKDVDPNRATTQTGRLCFDETRSRTISTSTCVGFQYDDYIIFTERVIDYGIEVVYAGPGTQVTAQIAYPFEASVGPDQVAFAPYGQAYDVNVRDGKVTATFSP